MTSVGRIIHALDPVEAQDYTTKNYVDAADNLRYLATTPLNAITLAATDVNLNNHKITSLSAPTTANDAATKSYVDATAGIGSSRSLD